MKFLDIAGVQQLWAAVKNKFKGVDRSEIDDLAYPLPDSAWVSLNGVNSSKGTFTQGSNNRYWVTKDYLPSDIYKIVSGDNTHTVVFCYTPEDEYLGMWYVNTLDFDKTSSTRWRSRDLELPKGNYKFKAMVENINTSSCSSADVAEVLFYAESPKGTLENVSTRFPVKTITGTDFWIMDAAELTTIKVEGTSPVTVSGVSLIDFPRDLTINGVKYFTLPQPMPAGKYTFLYDRLTKTGGGTTYVSTNFYNGGAGLALTNTRKKVEFTISAECSNQFYIQADGYTWQDKTATFENLMLLKANQNQATPYQHYVEPKTYAPNENVFLYKQINVVHSDTPVTITYIQNTDFIETLLSGDKGISQLDQTLLGYVTPEMFGALGDEDNDDSEAVNNAIATAAALKVPMYGYKRYKCSQPIRITENQTKVKINRLLSTSSEAGLIVDGSTYSDIEIDYIKNDNGDGIQIYGSTRECHHTVFRLGEVISGRNGIHFLKKKSIYSLNFTFNKIQAGGSSYYGILADPATEAAYLGQGNFYSEFTFRGGWITNAHYAVAIGLYGARFENIQVEVNVDGGFWFYNGGNCTVINDRHEESSVNGSASFYKIGFDPNFANKPDDATSGAWINICENQAIRLNQIDLSENYVEIDNGDSARTPIAFSASGIIHNRIQASNRALGSYLSNYSGYMGEEAIIWGRRLIMKPLYKREKHFNANQDLTLTDQTFYPMATTFIIDANCELKLPASYCFAGVNEFEVVQHDGYHVRLLNCDGTEIFNGANYGNGTYILKHVVVHSVDTPQPRYDWSGTKWVIEEKQNTVMSE